MRIADQNAASGWAQDTDQARIRVFLLDEGAQWALRDSGPKELAIRYAARKICEQARSKAVILDRIASYLTLTASTEPRLIPSRAMLSKLPL